MALTATASEIQGYLEQRAGKVRVRGNKIAIEKCTFCKGGDSQDKWTMAVFVPEGNYICLRGSCGATGTFWGLVEAMGDEPKDFYGKDNNWTPMKKSLPPIQPATERTTPINFSSGKVEQFPLTEEAQKYILARGLTLEAVEDCKMFCDKDGNICFPYFHDNEICNVKVRKPRKPQDKEPKAWSAWKGGLLNLWGFEDCQDGRFLIIVFGEYDRVALKTCGLHNVVSVPNGDAATGWIDLHWKALQEFEAIYLWTDNDVAGNKALHDIAARLGKQRIKHIQSPYNDANEMLLLMTREVGFEAACEAMVNVVADAPWYWTSDLIQVADIGDRDLSFDGYLSGFPTVDEVMGGFFDGNMTVHTGDSGAGKSTGLGLVILNAVAQDAKVAVWSGEDDEFDFKRRLSLQFAGTLGTIQKLAKRSGKTYSIVTEEYQAKFNDFVRDRLFLYNKRRGVDEHQLFDTFDLAFNRYGCTVFVMDNLMKAVTAKETADKYFRQAAIINQASDFAKDTMSHVHVVAHMNKTGEPLEPPTKNSVSGAKEITNLADNVLAWWRIPEKVKDHFSGDTLLCLLKHRFGGMEASFPLQYDWRTKRMAERVADLDERLEYKFPKDNAEAQN